MKKVFKSKKLFKHRYGKCPFCQETNYNVLDVHRWRKEGHLGGKYSPDNSIVVCSNCHRKIHNNIITIIDKRQSTAGEVVIFKENGKEYIKLL